MNATIVDVLIENIKTDQDLLQTVEAKIETAKDEKQTIVNRLKEQQKDISVLLKYADEKQHAKIEALGFSFSETQKGLNTIASTAFDLILKAKNNQLTNQELYDGYVNSLKNKDEAVKYSEFNIKCRSLFNTQKLLRKKGSDPKSSKQDIISLNGRVLPKDDKVAVKTEPSKTSQNKKKDDTVSK
ncbi:hypothetical protein [uncultured Lacinutrix sp.]|uniref:hypothetical protein n=1 Tax=uncultured Lacinutrix sp. TaxID=574032 RepID=UPI0026197E0B|nr:hypothetical protein [uncultured Lacinutrix sp.]